MFKVGDLVLIKENFAGYASYGNWNFRGKEGLITFCLGPEVRNSKLVQRYKLDLPFSSAPGCYIWAYEDEIVLIHNYQLLL